MALKLTHNGDVLEIKTIAQLSAPQFSFVRNFLNSLEGSEYDADNYRWFVPKHHLDDVLDKLEDMTVFDEPVEDIKGIIEDLTPDFPVTNEFLDELKLQPFPYQFLGISFLVNQERAIVGDVMGLGKSLQAIGATHILHRREKVSRVLVICPASLKYQWHEEIGKFTDHGAVVIDGTTAKRGKQYDAFLQSEDLYCIINYELVRNDLEKLKTMPFDVIVCDEAHRIKNRTSKTFKALIQLNSPYKFALTGTPMQNRPEEIHALMSWIDKDALGGITKFRERHVVTGTKFGRRFVPLGAKRLGEIRRKISPYMIRRTKEEVAPDLPPLIESQYYVDMSKEQREMTSSVTELIDQLSQEVEDFFRKNPDAKEHKSQDQVMGYLGMLIAISDHPRLLSLSKSANAQRIGRPGAKATTSPKLEALIELSEQAIANGDDKIVVFTQYATMKTLIDQRLRLYFGESSVGQGIEGKMKPIDRQRSLNEFRFSDDIKFFVCTDAANYGLNMGFASLLFNYDLPWNPSVRAQRNGRIHRIDGKLERYNVVDLITNDSIDEVIWGIIQKKEKLGEKIIGKNKKEQESMRRLMGLLR